MDEEWKDVFRLHAKNSEGYEENVREANQIIKKAFCSKDKLYVSYSGGKDSLVMTDLVLGYCSDVLVYHHCVKMPGWVRDEILRNVREVGADNLVVRGKNECLWSDIIPDFKRKGFDGVFVGLRKEESCRRKNRISKKEHIGDIEEFWPLQSWSWMDVWGYIVVNDLSYCSVYDIYGPVLGWDKVRFHSFFDSDFDWLGNSNIDGFLLWRDRYGD